MVTLNLTQIAQYASMLVACFGIVASLIRLFSTGGFNGVITSIFVLIFTIALLMVEIWVPSFIKYFGFLMKFWGKAGSYLYIGCILWSNSAFGWICGILFWATAVLYLAIFFMSDGVAPPITQKDGVPMETSNNNYFGNDQA